MESETFDQFQASLTQRLLGWSGLSIASGLILAFLPKRFWRGMGHQFLGWGLVDGVIALLGMGGMQRRRQKRVSYPVAAEELDSEARTMATILAVNSGLDILYVAGGAQTISKKGADDDYWRGAGWGIILQGGFLLIFDLIHYFILRQTRKGKT